MFTLTETSRCLLCNEAPCSAICPKGQDPARGIRAIRFDNPNNAGVFFGPACADCDAPCQKACIAYDRPIRIKDLAATVKPREKEAERDLSIDFCGIRCENPFFVGSAVTASGYEMIARAFDLGWAGVAYKTISKMDIREVSPRFDMVGKEGTPFVGFRNMEQLSEHSLAEDLAIISRLKKNYPSKVVIASIMGRDEAEWAELAKLSQEAGADIVECNFSCPQMATKGTGSDVGQCPELVKVYSKAVKDAVTIPVLAKMTPNITHICEPAAAALEGGADGISAINTIKSVTITYRGEVNRNKTISGYSGKAIKPISQRMIVEMGLDPRTKDAPISGIGGIETWRDATEYILVGCTNVQVVTAIMQYGYRIIDDLKSGLADCLERHGHSSVRELVGYALKGFAESDDLDRSSYILPKIDHSKCLGCGRCAISCADGGHQAISFGPDRVPHVIGQKCVGCLLCTLICPAGAIGRSKRIPKN